MPKRRQMRYGPYKRVVSTSEQTFSTVNGISGSRIERLECGHSVAMKRSIKRAGKRRCIDCANGRIPP